MKDAVIGIILNETQDQVLLIKRRDVPVWVLPGGGLEAFEIPEEAVVREVLEETGLQVKVMRKTGEYTPINKLASFTHVFECQIIAGTPQIGDETQNIAFFLLTALPKTFFFLHAEWLQDLLTFAAFPLQKPIHSITYRRLCLTCLQNPWLVVRALCARLGWPINSK